jgi:APA family basic amino acid/polyamine antiporter
VTAPRLVRVLGRWDLVAFVINGVLGAGIFGLPAKVHALLGAWGVVAIIACALLMGIIIACFAEVSSRFRETGGPFLYAVEAFGPIVGFLVGWLLWLSRITGICAVTGIMVEYVAYLVPSVANGAPRAAFVVAVIAGLSLLHVSGVKRAANVGNILTVLKLAPLLLLVSVGIFRLVPARFDFTAIPSNHDFSNGVLLLAFAFVGWESALVAAGELRDPRRDMPFAIAIGLAAVALLYVAIQVVCVDAVPQLATSARPLADAARATLGPAGATLIVVGAVVSMLGTINGGVLTVSRITFAMADAGQLPRGLAAVHPRYLTPVVSIALAAVVSIALTLSSTFVYLLTVSTIARLLIFAVCCVALPVLRRREADLPALIRIPGGVVIPALALALIAWLIAGSSWRETGDVVIAVAVGAMMLALAKTTARGTQQSARAARESHPGEPPASISSPDRHPE